MHKEIKQRVKEIERLIELRELVHSNFCQCEPECDCEFEIEDCSIRDCSMCNKLKNKIEERIQQYGEEGFFSEPLEDDLLNRITIH